MKKSVVFGIMILIVSLMSDCLLAYNFMSVINEKLDSETLSFIQFLYIFICFVSYWLTIISISYIFGGKLKTSLKYVGIIISIGIIIGLIFGTIFAAVYHDNYCGNIMVTTIMGWLIFTIFGSIVYPAHAEIVETVL